MVGEPVPVAFGIVTVERGEEADVVAPLGQVPDEEVPEGVRPFRGGNSMAGERYRFTPGNARFQPSVGSAAPFSGRPGRLSIASSIARSVSRCALFSGRISRSSSIIRVLKGRLLAKLK